MIRFLKIEPREGAGKLPRPMTRLWMVHQSTNFADATTCDDDLILYRWISIVSCGYHPRPAVHTD
ncbi:MAG: hypothetical protein AAFY27_04250 [Pseudomonadota bacterium]